MIEPERPPVELLRGEPVSTIRQRFQRAFPAGISVGRQLDMTPERIRSLNDIEDLLYALVSPAAPRPPDEDTLHAAIHSAWEAEHSDLRSGLTTDPKDATLAAEMVRRWPR